MPGKAHPRPIYKERANMEPEQKKAERIDMPRMEIPQNVIHYRLVMDRVKTPAHILEILAFFVAGQVTLDEKMEEQFLNAPISRFYDKWEPSNGEVREGESEEKEAG
jgi:hypothetical protein